eukprot:3997135-Amphidinium_carterae.1
MASTCTVASTRQYLQLQPPTTFLGHVVSPPLRLPVPPPMSSLPGCPWPSLCWLPVQARPYSTRLNARYTNSWIKPCVSTCVILKSSTCPCCQRSPRDARPPPRWLLLYQLAVRMLEYFA